MDSHFRGNDIVASFKLSALSLEPRNGYEILDLIALLVSSPHDELTIIFLEVV